MVRAFVAKERRYFLLALSDLPVPECPDELQPWAGLAKSKKPYTDGKIILDPFA